jgi:hypothetical protein
MIDQQDGGVILVQTDIGLAYGVTPCIDAGNPALLSF